MHVLISCPSSSGLLHARTLASVFGMTQTLKNSGYTFEFAVLPYMGLIAARNHAATRLFAGECDLLVGIDDDVGAEGEAFETMVTASSVYIGACIPQRVMSLERLAEGVRDRGLNDRDAMRYAAPLVNGPQVAPGISETNRVSSGFFVLRREPLTAMVNSGAVAKKVEHTPAGPLDVYGFYDCIHGEDGTRLSEESSFCQRVIDAGFAVHAYKGPGLNHSGEMTFHS